jgi:hypothetical protein
MPTGNEMVKILHSVNVMYKAELALAQFVTLLLWTSFSEMFLWCGLFLTFCAAASHTGIIWLQIVHLARGVLGFLLCFKFPRSHEMLEGLALENKAYDVESLKSRIQFSLSVQIIDKAEENKRWLWLYSGATLWCFLTDIMCFAIQYRWYEEGQIDYTNLWMMVVSLMYLLFDVIYIFWIAGF